MRWVGAGYKCELGWGQDAGERSGSGQDTGVKWIVVGSRGEVSWV